MNRYDNKRPFLAEATIPNGQALLQVVGGLGPVGKTIMLLTVHAEKVLEKRHKWTIVYTQLS